LFLKKQTGKNQLKKKKRIGEKTEMKKNKERNIGK